MSPEKMHELRDTFQVFAGALELRLDTKAGFDTTLRSGLVELTKALARDLGLELLPLPQSFGKNRELTSEQKLSAIALTFPALERHAQHAILPFDALALAEWRAPGPGAKCAAAFVLSLWSNEHERRFDLHEALQCWDYEDRHAFLDWARDPWWP